MEIFLNIFMVVFSVLFIIGAVQAYKQTVEN